MYNTVKLEHPYTGSGVNLEVDEFEIYAQSSLIDHARSKSQDERLFTLTNLEDTETILRYLKRTTSKDIFNNLLDKLNKEDVKKEMKEVVDE